MSKIIDKIRALLAKTTAAGCTEAEALSAAEIARRLMLEHDLSMMDVQEREEFVRGDKPLPKNIGIEVWLSGPIADFFDSECVRRRVIREGRLAHRLEFFGREADVLMAEWLHDTLVATAKRDFKSYSKTLPPECRRSAKESNGFYIGFASRISVRLIALKKESAARAPSAMNALVVKRDAARDQAFALAYPKVRPASRCNRQADWRAMSSGERAANAASLSRPVEGARGPAMIGRAS